MYKRGNTIKRIAIRSLLGTLALLSAACPVAAQPPVIDYSKLPVFPDPRPSIIRQPERVSAPSAADFSKLYPPKAAAIGLNGAAVVSCAVSRTGRMQNCYVEWESPEGYGFGEAALKLAALYQMRAGERDGKAIEWPQMRAPIRFVIEPAAPLPTIPRLPGPKLPGFMATGAPYGAYAPAPADLENITLPEGRLGLLGASRSGTMHFVTLDEPRTSGRMVEATWFSVSAGEQPWEAPYRVWNVRIDCATSEQLSLGSRSFDRSLQPSGWNYGNEAGSETVSPDLPLGQVAEVACSRKAPAAIVTGYADAMAVAEGWPR